MRLLDALNCRNVGRPPVWLMRQAGRYLPEYRALRQKHSLWEMFHEPELAVQATLQPVDILQVDAAILFSDILVIAEALGCKIHFPASGGPQVELPTAHDALRIGNVEQSLSYVFQTIRQLRKQLRVPLIGFCGGPYTVTRYMLKDVLPIESMHQLLQKITDASIAYLQLQVAAGAQAVQIFDSWAGLLPPDQFADFSLKYLKQMVDALKSSGVPIAIFTRNAALYPQELAALQPAAISFDHLKSMDELRRAVPINIAVQGNLDPQFLRSAAPAQVTAATQALLHAMRGEPGFIANLGHGVLPDTPVANVQAFVNCVLEEGCAAND